MNANRKILTLTRYGPLGASSRLRFYQYGPFLRESGFDLDLCPLFESEDLRNKYVHGSYPRALVVRRFMHRALRVMGSSRHGLLWIEKELLPWIPSLIERILLGGRRYVIDFDDAIFHSYDLHSSRLIRSALGSKIPALMRHSGAVVAGSQYLADHAHEAGSRKTYFIPTAVDLARYPVTDRNRKAGRSPIVVWIGSPSSEQYLSQISEILEETAKHADFTLRIIGASHFAPAGVRTEHIKWSEETEAAMIAECDIGIMPLVDSPWERGKCGYKLIQYMACGLPVIASPVGENRTIVRHGINGLLASNPSEWRAALLELLTDQTLRERMGAAGRERVARAYCTAVTAPRIADILSVEYQRSCAA